MADYDVGVLGLSSPPPSSVLTPYRPAVSVRNNGIHDALASGTLRIYAADRLIFTTELYSATIPAGETRDALGTDYWTPPAEGKFLVIADVTCPLDQVESNNHLSPTAIAVGGGPPPPPTTVAPHGSQHEDGGADEVNIDGLHGRAADAQTALAHKASHQTGGADTISVEGLPGQLLEAQGIRDHAQTHEAAGDDRLNVDGLHGQLYNVQKPDVHDNAAHDPNYAKDADLTTHKTATTAHDNRRNVAGGFCGLGSDALVPTGNLAPEPITQLTHFLKVDKTWTEAQELSEKGQAGGYPELDAFSHVPKDQLGTENVVPPDPSDLVLFSDSTWRIPLNTPSVHGSALHNNAAPAAIQPLFIAGEGVSTSVARADHLHRAAGCSFTRTSPAVIADGNYHTLVSQGALGGHATVGTHLRLTAFGTITTGLPAAEPSFQLWLTNVAIQFNPLLVSGLTNKSWRLSADCVIVDATPGAEKARVFAELVLESGLSAIQHYVLCPNTLHDVALGIVWQFACLIRLYNFAPGHSLSCNGALAEVVKP